MGEHAANFCHFFRSSLQVVPVDKKSSYGHPASGGFLPGVLQVKGDPTLAIS